MYVTEKFKIIPPFTENDFIDHTGIRSEDGTSIVWQNAFLTQSGAVKVAYILGVPWTKLVNVDKNNGWNGKYESGVLYGPRAGVGRGDQGWWRWADPQADFPGVELLPLDSYLPLIMKGKFDIARYAFQNRHDPKFKSAGIFGELVLYPNVDQVKAMVEARWQQKLKNDAMQRQQQVYQQVQSQPRVYSNNQSAQSASNNAGGTVVRQGASEERKTESTDRTYSRDSTYAPGRTGTTEAPVTNVTIETESESESKSKSNRFDLKEFMSKEIEIGSTKVPMVVLIGGGLVVFSMMRKG